MEHSEGEVSESGSSHPICKCESKTLIKTTPTAKNHGKMFYVYVNYVVRCVKNAKQINITVYAELTDI
jgi:hypothetical protein